LITSIDSLLIARRSFHPPESEDAPPSIELPSGKAPEFTRCGDRITPPRSFELVVSGATRGYRRIVDADAGVIIGAGGHALVCIEVLERMGLSVAGCVSSDGTAAADIDSLGIAMLGTIDDLDDLLAGGRWAFVAVGDNAVRRSLAERVTDLGAELVPAISPDATVSRSAMVEAGALVMPGAIVNAQARIGLGAIVNTGARVDHECSIGAFAHIAPGATLGGSVTVGDETLVGIGSTTRPGVTIGARVVVGAGAVVVGDISAEQTVVGVPARPVAAPDHASGTDGITNADDLAATSQPTESVVVQREPVVPKILVVCTGNLNRSPVAEILLRRALGDIGVEAEITSAGLAAPAGSRVDTKLRKLADELGVSDEIDTHRSTQLTPGHLAADLIIGMTGEHVDDLRRVGADPTRTTTLRTAAWRSRVIGRQDLRFDEWVQRLTAPLPDSAQLNGVGVEDIADPIGGRMRQYRAMGAEVSDLVNTLVSHWGGR
jgi:UDP-perosamine 4-acetyltransferase